MYVLDPVHYYVAVESAADVMQKLQLANADAPPPTGNIWMPDSSATDGIGSDSAGTRGGKAKGGAILNLLVGRVWWCGPGKHWEGAFVVPSVKKGDLILFSPRVVSHELLLHGRSFKIVPWSEVISKVREVAADSPEALELKREVPLAPPGLLEGVRAALAETQAARPEAV